MELFPPAEATLAGTLDALRSGRTSCREVLERCLDRIDDREHEVHAWAFLDRDGARAQADRLDADHQVGRPFGPLGGIPIGVKDIIHVAGMPTEYGIPGFEELLCKNLSEPEADELRGSTIPEADAPIVADLRRRGAIILGKAVTTPYAWIDPPPTRNPWNLDHTPGGSSSGPAAAVACGMCLGALGSQTGGSITRPASYCGVAGFKPTYGSWSAEGILPLAQSLDHPGPIALTIADLALLANIRPFLTDRPLTIGRLRHWFDERTEPAMLDAMEQATAALQAAGHRVVRLSMPSPFPEIPANHFTILSAEAAGNHYGAIKRSPECYPPRITKLIEEGLHVTYVDFLVAKHFQEKTRWLFDSHLGEVDALLTPAALGPAPDPSTTGDPAFNSPWSFLGLPTITHPIALSPNGLPLGLQLTGRSGPEGEAALFGVALRTEAALRKAAGAAELPPFPAD
ncbi:amidase [Tautonia rosea]|uniref:amidase n=1 Tax=Tautonia rosea TaxID=2728037 RepID=UPI001474A8DD|nr:amidase [Tautonia rosea]